MSLIEEALRRAQTAPPPAKTPATTPAPAAPSASSGQSLPEMETRSWSLVGEPKWPKAKRWAGIAVGTTAAALLALWSSAIVWRWQLAKTAALPSEPRVVVSNPTPAAEPPRAAPIQPTAAQTPASTPRHTSSATASVSRSKRLPMLTLNGIVQGRGEPLAIINGMILRVGEDVSGATVLDIRKDEATLRWKDEVVVLSTTP